MAVKVLGQSAPGATTLTTLYTVPSGKSTVASTLVVCNRSASTVSYRIAVRPAGASISNEHYIAYGTGLAAGGADFLSIGMTLTATDVVSVYGSTADLSFSLFGDES
jgi:hypothetical protein